MSHNCHVVGVVIAMLVAPCWCMAFNPLDTTNEFDYVILSHDSFQAQATRLLNHRSSGLRACLVLTSEVSSSFSGANDVEKIRQFVAFAYEHWKIAPTYLVLIGDANSGAAIPETIAPASNNFLPSHLTYNQFFSWQGDHLFAEDGWYVNPVDGGDVKPVMHIGRLSVRSSAQLSNIIDKIIYYDGIAGTPAWLGRIAMLVGDANINTNNEIYRIINDHLFDDELSAWSPVPTRLYSADFWPAQWPEEATAATKLQFDNGVGLLNAFGNTNDYNFLVHMAEFFPIGAPTFVQTLSPSNHLPLVFAASCLPNYFYRDGAPSGMALSEDLLFTANNRGAIAVVGPSHVNDIIECGKLNKTFLHLLIHDGVRNVGRLLSATKAIHLQDPLAHDLLVRQLMLMGDPALNVKLHSLPASSAFLLGMEIEGLPALQNRVISKSGGVIGEQTRVVHLKDGTSPVFGERMLQAKMLDQTGSADHIEWRLLDDLGIVISRNMVLSFMINILTSPSGLDKVCIDGNTSGGRIKNHAQVFDQNGYSLDARLRPTLAPGWQPIYVDLSPMEGMMLQDIRLRYETTNAGEFGNLNAFVDDVSVESIHSDEFQEILNLSFENDRDGNQTPDFWTSTAGEITTSTVLRRDTLPAMDGECYMQVFDESCAGLGAQHVFHANADVPYYGLAVHHRSPDPTVFRIVVIDAHTGGTLSDELVNCTTSWNTTWTSFENPGFQTGTRRIKIQFFQDECVEEFYIDNVLVEPLPAIGIGEASIPAESPRLLSISPNPAVRLSAVQSSFHLPKSSSVRILVFDVNGREVGASASLRYGSGTRFLALNKLEEDRIASGVYFIRLEVDGRVVPDGMKLTVMR